MWECALSRVLRNAEFHWPNVEQHMSEQYLSIYLNDHLAGSVVALELVEHLCQAHPDSALSGFARALHDDNFY